MKRISFTTQIALAMAAAVLMGLALQFFGCEAWTDRLFAPGGRIFLNLIKFIVCPLVLFSVLGGIVSMDDVKKVGILGVKTVTCFFVTTLVAGVDRIFDMGRTVLNIVGDTTAATVIGVSRR